MTGTLSVSTPLLGSKGEASQQSYFGPALDQNAYATDSYFESERRRQHTRRRWYFVLILAVILLFSFRHEIHHFARKHSVGRNSEIMSGEFGGAFDIWPGDPHGEYECVHGEQWDEIDSPSTNAGDDHRFSAKTSFSLPIDSDALTFVARGAYTYGHVDIVSGDSDDVSVDIVARYHDRPALDRVTVCRFHYDEDGRDGVGIFSPRQRHGGGRWETVYLHMVIRLPPHGARIRQVPTFTTVMPLFSQTVNNLTEAFEFGDITLGSTNQQINVKDIRASSVTAQTTNAAIVGSFNTSDSLKLMTTNSPIKVDVTAFNHDHTNEILLHTTNALLAANLSLIKSAAAEAEGHFKVTTTTTNGQLRINYLTSPADSVLEAIASTTNSPAWVRLDSAYEGSFVASTTHFSPTLERVTDVEDPAGRGRSRHVDIQTRIRSVVTGSASWQPSEHERGHPGSVNVHTTNSPLYLTV